MKTCNKCQTAKPRTEFHKCPTMKGGLNAWCKVCKREYDKSRGPRTEQHRRYYAKHADRLREARFIRDYNLTYEERDVILEAQANKCAVCGITFSLEGKQPQVDHCHVTGKVRGILCVNCNTGLGKLGDNAESLKAAYNYLKRSAL